MKEDLIINNYSKNQNILFYNAIGNLIEKHQNARPKLLVFDSGIGGLSVSKHLEKKFNYTDIIYIADNEFFPYGDKDRTILKGRVETLILQAIKVFKPIACIIACNTASTLISDDFIDNLNIPCMRVLPPIQEAFELSITKKVLLIATPNTINSNFVQINSSTIDYKDFTFHKLGVTKLVKLAEKKSRNEQIKIDDIKNILLEKLSLKEIEKIDVVILGCTHFPSIVSELNSVLFNVKHWVDPAYTIVNQLHEYLYGNLSILSKGKYLFCTSNLKDESFHTPYFNNGFQ